MARPKKSAASQSPKVRVPKARAPSRRALKTAPAVQAAEYRHKEEALARPDVGTQPQFRKKAPPRTWRYDSSLAPALNWDGQNPGREQGEAAIAELEQRVAALRKLAASLTPDDTGANKAVAKVQVGLQAELQAAEETLRRLKALSRPFLDWAGKAERLSFDVPTLPLFVHDRLSTRAILETLKGHRREKQLGLFDLFADPQRPVHEQVLRAYEYRDDWVNRMILGDSLVAMNSLLHYESLGGQVQMIYMDPPYGVKFGSNFQPFVRKRDVTHNDDEDMTREPEMVQAYRDTWELGLHSYLSYLRDRLLLSRDLLAPSGSIFVQISDENLHHVREVMDEVFGAENFISVISFAKTSSASGELLSAVTDYLLWYSKDKDRLKYHQLFLEKEAGAAGGSQYTWAEAPDGTRKNYGSADKLNLAPEGSRIFVHDNLTSQRPAQGTDVRSFNYESRDFKLRKGTFKTETKGLENLARARRLIWIGETLRYVRFLDDFPVFPISNNWTDTGTSGFAASKLYVVQTNPTVIQRCLLMTTDPGDIVIDPTCGSGTTAYVAEQWGRRWITMDTSRVPLALARQRLLTATFPWYELKDEQRGPTGGFVYKRKQNQKGEEVGGIVPHITLGSIANNEPAAEEVLVDRPEELKGVTRVTGPFVVEATIPTVMELEGDGKEPAPPGHAEVDSSDFTDRLLEVLRRSPVVQVGGKQTVTLRNLRRPAKTLSLSAEAMVDAEADAKRKGRAVRLDEALQSADEANRVSLAFSGQPVALVFGPENGAVAERLVYEAAKEAAAKNYTHLYVFGFAIQPNARQLIDACDQAVGIAATYVQATPDLLMGDLLKNMRSSQIFSVCGLPEVEVRKAKRPAHLPTVAGATGSAKNETWYEVELQGLDVFDPQTMEVQHRTGNDVPAWFVDTDYNGLSFHVCQAFFPRTQAWDSLRRALKTEYEDAVWQHLAGTVSVAFEPGDHGQIAVKVIDDRGNELMVVKSLKDVK